MVNPRNSNPMFCAQSSQIGRAGGIMGQASSSSVGLIMSGAQSSQNSMMISCSVNSPMTNPIFAKYS